MRKPCHFRQRDLTAALKAAKAAGGPVKVEIENGKMTVVTDGKSLTTESKNNEWDEVFDDDDQA